MTSALAQRTVSLPVIDETGRLLMRLNPSLFHGVGLLLVIDAAAQPHAGDPPSVPRRRRRALLAELRGWAEALWPEIDWAGACRTSAGHARLAWMIEDLCGSPLAAVWHARCCHALAAMAEAPTLAALLRQLGGRASSVNTPLAPGRSGRFRTAFDAFGSLRRLDAALRVGHALVLEHAREAAPFPATAYDASIGRLLAVAAPHLALDPTRSVLLRLALRTCAANRPAPAAVTLGPGSRDPIAWSALHGAAQPR